MTEEDLGDRQVEGDFLQDFDKVTQELPLGTGRSNAVAIRKISELGYVRSFFRDLQTVNKIKGDETTDDFEWLVDSCGVIVQIRTNSNSGIFLGGEVVRYDSNSYTKRVEEIKKEK